MANPTDGVQRPNNVATPASDLVAAGKITGEQADRMTDGTVSLVDLRVASRVLNSLEANDPLRGSAEAMVDEILTEMRSQSRYLTALETADDSGDPDSVLRETAVLSLTAKMRILDQLNRVRIGPLGETGFRDAEQAKDVTSSMASRSIYAALCELVLLQKTAAATDDNG